jgi:hypothetical protein
MVWSLNVVLDRIKYMTNVKKKCQLSGESSDYIVFLTTLNYTLDLVYLCSGLKILVSGFFKQYQISLGFYVSTCHALLGVCISLLCVLHVSIIYLCFILRCVNSKCMEIVSDQDPKSSHRAQQIQ